MSLISTSHEPISHPNVFTAVGALCLDATLRRDFFHPEARALQQLLPSMEEHEFQRCLSLCPSDPNSELEGTCSNVGALFCRRTPCPAATANGETVLGAAVLDLNFRDAWFKNPETAPAEYGFDLSEEENILLCAILDKKGGKIREAVEALGNMLKKMEISFTPIAKLPPLQAKSKAA